MVLATGVGVGCGGMDPTHNNEVYTLCVSDTAHWKLGGDIPAVAGIHTLESDVVARTGKRLYTKHGNYMGHNNDIH